MGTPTDSQKALEDLAAAIRAGNRAALARGISLVENERAGFQHLLHGLLSSGLREGPTPRIGVTGPPGAGKSSLVTSMAGRFREEDREVGIVAVDPTSPYSGGALLGDRIRMNELTTDPGVFIRSMASRGSLGGLAVTTKEVLDLMDVSGFARLIVETVGVGQTELEITSAADTVVVVLVPESGDAVQAMKAGLMEIADVFVVNKADRPGADRLQREIRGALQLRGRGGETPSRAHVGHHGPGASGRAPLPKGEAHWAPPVLLTEAHRGKGVVELLQAVDDHRNWMVSAGELERRRQRRAVDRIRDVMERELRRRARRALADDDLVGEALRRIRGGEATPYSEASRLLAGLGVDADTAPLPPAT
ncbi:MAG: methylmalonyl Co-A mutase-associated GTPase MeaB [Gemmatimonadota bacterium]